MKGKKVKLKLKYSMVGIIIMVWLVPLLFFTYMLLIVFSSRMNSQIEKTIIASADKAIDICEMQIEDAMAASRNASYITTIWDSYEQFKVDGNVQNLYSSVTLFLNQQYMYNKNFLCTMLFFTDNPEEIYYTYGNSNISNANYLSVREFQEHAFEAVKKRAEEIDTGVELMYVDGRTYMIRNMVDSSFHPYAVIVMELNTESVFESLESVWGATNYNIFLDGVQLVNQTDMPYFDVQKLETATVNSIYVRDKKEAYVYKTIKSENHKIGFVMELDTQVIVDELLILQSMLALILVLMVPLLYAIFAFFYRKINSPVERLVTSAKEITKRNYGYQIEDVETSQEFDYLAASFNAMSLELKYQFEQIYLEELALKDAEIMALQSQINPHFLNNTLEIINWECRMTGNTKTSSMIEALSIMLNATMNRKKQNMIPLLEELSYVDAYLLIIQQRFGTRLKVTKHIDHSILQVEVPRLIIQPIIENAVEHGMDVKNQGRVSLDIYRDGDKVYIDVTNNGVMTEQDREKIAYLLGPDYKDQNEKSTSLGIRNVNRRLKIIYGKEYGLTITSNEEGFTVSSIVIDMNYTNTQHREE